MTPLPPRPLNSKPMTRHQIGQLEWHVYAAVNRWRYSCVLCGNLRYNKKTGLCRRCAAAPLDTVDATDCLNERDDRRCHNCGSHETLYLVPAGADGGTICCETCALWIVRNFATPGALAEARNIVNIHRQALNLAGGNR